MDRAHTKGPWRATRDCFGDFTIQPQNEELAIAAVVNGEMRRMGGLSGEQEANARLIAAAPDLLDACKRASEILRGRGFPGWGIAKDILNEAIAKAEGRPNLADATQNPPSMEGR